MKARPALLAVLSCSAWLSNTHAQAPAAAAPPDRQAADHVAVVPSMTGTPPGGAGRGSRLELKPELAYLFDDYLAGLGERPLNAIRAELVRDLEQRLDAVSAMEAGRLLDAYLAYKRALVDVERGLSRQAGPARRARQRLEALQRLRPAYFSAAEIRGLFAAADAYDLDAIARLEIAGDAGLSDAQRRQRLAALDARLSPQAREEREAPSRVLRLEDAVAKARAQGADENAIYRMRAAALSPTAAERLAEVDREEAAWQRRISAYQSEHARLRREAADSAALQRLRDDSFTADEQRRLPAYER